MLTVPIVDVCYPYLFFRNELEMSEKRDRSALEKRSKIERKNKNDKNTKLLVDY
jgi:hypothetical protein